MEGQKMINPNQVTVLASTPGIRPLLVVWDHETDKPWLVRAFLLEGETNWYPMPGELWSQGPIGWKQRWEPVLSEPPTEYPYSISEKRKIAWTRWLGQIPLVWFVEMRDFDVPKLADPSSALPEPENESKQEHSKSELTEQKADDEEGDDQKPSKNVASFGFKFKGDPKYELLPSQKDKHKKRWQLVVKKHEPKVPEKDFLKEVISPNWAFWWPDRIFDPSKTVGAMELSGGHSPAVAVATTDSGIWVVKGGMDEEDIPAVFLDLFDDLKDQSWYIGGDGVVEIGDVSRRLMAKLGAPVIPSFLMYQDQEDYQDLLRHIGKYVGEPDYLLVSPYIDVTEPIPAERLGRTDEEASDAVKFLAAKRWFANTLIGPPDRHAGNVLAVPVVNKEGRTIDRIKLDFDFEWIANPEDDGILPMGIRILEQQNYIKPDPEQLVWGATGSGIFIGKQASRKTILEDIEDGLKKNDPLVLGTLDSLNRLRKREVSEIASGYPRDALYEVESYLDDPDDDDAEALVDFVKEVDKYAGSD